MTNRPQTSRLIDSGTEGVVYAAVCLDGDERELELIKIGCSEHPSRRFEGRPFEIILSRPDVLHGDPSRGEHRWGETERRVLEFADRHGLRYEENDFEHVTQVVQYSTGSRELIRFDGSAIYEWSELLDDADHDVREFIQQLSDLHERGDVYS